MNRSPFLNTRIETALTLVVGALSAVVISAGTLGMGRSFDPRGGDGRPVVVASLERVVITSQRAKQVVQATTTRKL